MSTRRRKAYEAYGDYNGISRGRVGEILLSFLSTEAGQTQVGSHPGSITRPLEESDLEAIGILPEDTIRKVRRKLIVAITVLDPDLPQNQKDLGMLARLLSRLNFDLVYQTDSPSGDIRDFEPAPRFNQRERPRIPKMLSMRTDFQQILVWLDQDAEEE